jgi:hypothetical protein
MVKAGIDQDALMALLAQTGARRGELVRKAVFEATLKALQGRELTLENIRRVLKAATLASSAGAERNPGPTEELEALLAKAVAGMDAALIKAVQANRTALQQFMDLGVGLQDDHMKSAMSNLGRIEEVFIAVVGKAMGLAAEPLRRPWAHVLDGMRQHGTASGAQATQVVEQLVQQSHTALDHGRAASMRAAQTMMESYGALVSGVLMGLSDGIGKSVSGARADRRATQK